MISPGESILKCKDNPNAKQCSFPTSLWIMVHDHKSGIRWGPEGRTIIISYWKYQEQLLKFDEEESLLRQLELHCFTDVPNPVLYIYKHMSFVQGRVDLLKFVRKRYPSEKSPPNKRHSVQNISGNHEDVCRHPRNQKIKSEPIRLRNFQHDSTESTSGHFEIASSPNMACKAFFQNSKTKNYDGNKCNGSSTLNGEVKQKRANTYASNKTELKWNNSGDVCKPLTSSEKTTSKGCNNKKNTFELRSDIKKPTVIPNASTSYQSARTSVAGQKRLLIECAPKVRDFSFSNDNVPYTNIYNDLNKFQIPWLNDAVTYEFPWYNEAVINQSLPENKAVTHKVLSTNEAVTDANPWTNIDLDDEATWRNETLADAILDSALYDPSSTIQELLAYVQYEMTHKQ